MGSVATVMAAKKVLECNMIPITGKDIYDINPSIDHSSGDIWHNLPTFGTLPFPNLPSIIITPACDLAQRKTDTATYLPIIRIIDLFALPMHLPELQRALDVQLNAAGLGGVMRYSAGKFARPPKESIDAVEKIVESRLNNNRISKKDGECFAKIQSGLRLLRCNSKAAAPFDVKRSDVISLLGAKAFDKIITNSLAHIHFLPRDEQKEEYSGMLYHSVALFRFPLSIPIELLDCAQEISEDGWSAEVSRLAAHYPVANALKEARPIKRLTLRSAFASDLVARYIGLYVRLGSPDFSDGVLEGFKNEIGDVK